MVHAYVKVLSLRGDISKMFFRAVVFTQTLKGAMRTHLVAVYAIDGSQFVGAESTTRRAAGRNGRARQAAAATRTTNQTPPATAMPTLASFTPRSRNVAVRRAAKRS